MMRRYAVAITLGLVSALSWSHATPAARSQAERVGQSASTSTSVTSTRLPDGRWLIVGDQSGIGGAWLWDPQTGIAQPTSGSIQVTRVGHSATVLPDGSVLIVGGRHNGALVESPEVFDPAAERFTALPIVGATARAAHTATLTTDGRVVIAGGSNGGVTALPTEIWDVTARTATGIGSSGIDRSGHGAVLTADGGVLISGGRALDGSPATGAEKIDPATGATQRVNPQPARMVPIVTGSIPAVGATNVSLDAHMSLRFSNALTTASLSTDTVTLSGPDGAVDTRIVAGEDGRLAFIWPVHRLADNTTYVMRIVGAADSFGVPVVPTSIAFTTVRLSAAADGELWEPDLSDSRNGWRANRPASPWQKLAPLQAPPGVTALAGQTLRLNGEPLAGVTVEIDKHVAHSDTTGRFLIRLDGAPSGHAELWIEGRSARRGSATYGSYEVGVPLVAGRTIALPYTIWMPVIDTAHAVKIPSPTSAEVVVSTPTIPGLELRIPPHTTIHDHYGKPVTSITITPVPLDRPPFPLPAGVEVPVYFTTQPGGATLTVAGTGGQHGARLIYPNGLHLPAQSAITFWRYEPDGAGWEAYGKGRVTSDGQQIVPDPGVEVYEFTGAMAGGPGLGPDNGPPHPPKTGGDPVDLYTGLFVLEKTDLALPDVIPIALTRTYRQADTRSRAFGIGATHPYDIFLVGDTFPYTYLELVLEDGARIHYDRVSPGTGFADAVYQHMATPTDWYQSSIAWNGNGWTLTKKNGTILTFPDGFLITRPQQGALTSIQDRFGNLLTLNRDADANLTQVRSPNGRSITLTYDSSSRVTQLQDNIGRTVSYTYDSGGRLWKVTDPENGVTEYTYDSLHRMTTLKDARSNVFLTNEYDGNDRIIKQTQANSGTYQFAYSVDGQGQKVTAVTNPRGFVHRTTFNGSGYAVCDVEAVGTALERTTTTTRQASGNFVTSVVDSLNRQTTYSYDTAGHVLTKTRLAGTASAATTTLTYEPQFYQLATVEDPLHHTTTWTYDAQGHMSGTTDALGHHTTVALNSNGQLTRVTDALDHQWQFAYTAGDLTSATNPLNQTMAQFVDAGGRVVSRTDPVGRVTRAILDNLNRPTEMVDPAGGRTLFSYDANGNLLSVTDSLSHRTSYTYDTSDRIATRTDALLNAAWHVYDLNGNQTQGTDRKGQITARVYDALDRLTKVTFDDNSTIEYAYDAGDRVTSIVDSTNGTLTRTHDDFDRLTEETTPQGTVSYEYDVDGRRATMTVAGQETVTYAYDDAHRLTSITQGARRVALTYDDANRRSTQTWPNGIAATYGYDSADRLTNITYTIGEAPLGDITYGYDGTGRRTSVGGSWARTGLPQAVTNATYDAANRILTWNGASFSYDPNGNLTSDGTNIYVWNARNQLMGSAGAASSNFAYDGFGRRRSKTIGATVTNFLYDGLNFVQELTSGGTPTANLLTGHLDETLTRTDGSGVSTFLGDALGNTLEVADASGTLQTHYTFEPFGTTTISGAPSSNAQQFVGRENDGGGLYFMRARYYSQRHYRFISEDPLGFAGGRNVFEYAASAPTVYTDPFGLKPGPGFGPPGDGPEPPDPSPTPPTPDPPDRDRDPRDRDRDRDCGPTLGQQDAPSEAEPPSAKRTLIMTLLEGIAERFGGGAVVGGSTAALEAGAGAGNVLGIVRQRNNQLADACAISGGCGLQRQQTNRCFQ